jgi:secretion/DNA translocation related TadE-like protein
MLRAGDERGSGTMIMIGVVVVVLALAWAATVISGYLLAGHRAKSAADLAAVSGASAVLRGEQGCPTARRIAARQRAVARCEQVGDTIDFVVTVHAVVTVPLTLPGLPTQVGATGHAGPTVTGAATGALASPAR